MTKPDYYPQQQKYFSNINGNTAIEKVKDVSVKYNFIPISKLH